MKRRNFIQAVLGIVAAAGLAKQVRADMSPSPMSMRFDIDRSEIKALNTATGLEAIRHHNSQFTNIKDAGIPYAYCGGDS
jgi:hypothetical protein